MTQPTRGFSGLRIGIRVALIGIALIAMVSTAHANGCGNFYIIGHMANRPEIVDLAISQGANGVEMDLRLTASGDPQRFNHGWPCSCTLSHGGLCRTAKCSDQSAADVLLRHVAATDLAVVVIDVKAADVKAEALSRAGDNIAAMILTSLFRNKFKGSVIIDVSKVRFAPLLKSAMRTLSEQGGEFASRVYASIDQEGNHADRVITQLSAFTQQIAYGTGRTGAGTSFLPGIQQAKAQKMPFTYVWTVNRPDVARSYILAGISAIMTDQPMTIGEAARSAGKKMAVAADAMICGAE